VHEYAVTYKILERWNMGVSDLIILGFGIAVLAVFVMLIKNMNQKTEMGEDAFAATRRLHKQNQDLLKKYNDLNGKVNLLNKRLNTLSTIVERLTFNGGKGVNPNPQPNTGWICPKCSSRVAISQAGCPRCGYTRR
jgi:hypothetical protein